MSSGAMNWRALWLTLPSISRLNFSMLLDMAARAMTRDMLSWWCGRMNRRCTHMMVGFSIWRRLQAGQLNSKSTDVQIGLPSGSRALTMCMPRDSVTGGVDAITKHALLLSIGMIPASNTPSEMKLYSSTKTNTPVRPRALCSQSAWRVGVGVRVGGERHEFKKNFGGCLVLPCKEQTAIKASNVTTFFFQLQESEGEWKGRWNQACCRTAARRTSRRALLQLSRRRLRWSRRGGCGRRGKRAGDGTTPRPCEEKASLRGGYGGRPRRPP